VGKKGTVKKNANGHYAKEYGLDGQYGHYGQNIRTKNWN